MFEYVWVNNFKIDPREKILEYEPIGIKDRKTLKEQSIPTWKNLEKLLMEPIKVEGRLGGGVLICTDECFILFQRDESAPRAPGSLDINAGLGDATPTEVAENLNQPKIPIIARLMGEAYETIIKYRDKYIGFLPQNLGDFIPKEDDKGEIRNYLGTTFLNTTFLLENYLNKDLKFSIEVKEEGVIGRFKDGWRIKEKNLNPIDGALVTFEQDEKSVEIILPFYMPLEKGLKDQIKILDARDKQRKVVGMEFVFYDGEHSGSLFDIHDTGIISKGFQPLNRDVVCLYFDNHVEAYREGKKEYDGDFPGYVEKIKLPEMIRNGKTTGATSKVWKIYEEAKKGNEITIPSKGMSIPLEPFKEVGENLLELLNKYFPKV